MGQGGRVGTLLLLSTLCACKRDAPELGFALALTLTFDDSVDAATLARITRLVFHASGDELYDLELPLGRSAQRREELIYRPLPSTSSLTLDAEGDAGGVPVLAHGVSMFSDLVAGHTRYAELTLSSSGVPDGGGDLPPGDGGPLADGGVTQKPISFIAASLSSTAAHPEEVVTADFNGDGHPDVAVAATTGGKVQVFLTTLDGKLPAQPDSSSAVALQPSGLGAGDFTGDGKIDLVVADRTSSKVTILVNDGKGGFTAGASMNLPDAPDTLVVADFDRDGAADFAIASSASATVQVFYSGLAYANPVAVSMGMSTIRLVAPDLDGDAVPDLVALQAAGSTGAVVTRRNTQAVTARTFAAAPPALAINAVPKDISFVDVTGDGRPEAVVFTDSMDGYSTVLANDGAGTLSISATQVFTTNGTGRGIVVDFDGDGALDLVRTVPANGCVLIQHGFGGLNFEAPFIEARNRYAFGTDAFGLAVADLDGDGRLDLVVGNRGADTLSHARGRAARGIDAGLFTTYGGEQDVTLFDFNRDGKLDISMPYFNGVAILLGDGLGGFPNGASTSGVSGGLTCTALGDVNGDGLTDLVGGSYDGQLRVALGTGAASLGAFASTPVASSVSDVLLVDLDGDNHLDLLLLDGSSQADADSKNLFVFHGDGAGAFSAAPVTFAAQGAHQLLVTDLNGDGRYDVIVLSNKAQLTVFLGAGGGTFSSGVLHATPVANPSAAVVSDVNGDGKVDLVIAGDGIHSLLGVGDGSFTDGSDIAIGGHYSDLVAGDLDGDQRLDVMATTYASVELFRADTLGFTPAGRFAGGYAISRLAAGNFDGDKLADLVIISASGAVTLMNDTK